MCSDVNKDTWAQSEVSTFIRKKLERNMKTCRNGLNDRKTKATCVWDNRIRNSTSEH